MLATHEAPTQQAANTPKLETRIREACRVRHYSLATEKAYVGWYKRFVRWAGLKHPATLGGDVVERWLSHLATDGEVAASTQRQALAAILFLYQQVLGLKLPWLEEVDVAQRKLHAAQQRGVGVGCQQAGNGGKGSHGDFSFGLSFSNLPHTSAPAVRHSSTLATWPRATAGTFCQSA